VYFRLFRLCLLHLCLVYCVLFIVVCYLYLHVAQFLYLAIGLMIRYIKKELNYYYYYYLVFVLVSYVIILYLRICLFMYSCYFRHWPSAIQACMLKIELN
jgi:hypothetical protein